MCGIFGYVGKREAVQVLLSGLARLEYRGYDSAGVALKNGEEKTLIVKESGRLEYLQKKLSARMPCGKVGIGHTRWATHGAPTAKNAHPHQSADGAVTAVHNGIIENDKDLRSFLTAHGVPFFSETDTETAVNLIAWHYRLCRDPVTALFQTTSRLKGSYALAVLFEDHPHTVYAVRKENPLVLGEAEGERFVSSDVPALLPYTNRVYYMENGELAVLTADAIRFFDREGRETKKEATEITWRADSAEKGECEHFMLKEILEEPRAIRDTLAAFIRENRIDFSSAGLDEERLCAIRRLRVIGCGSAYHVGLAARRALEVLGQIPVSVEYASEFRYGEPLFERGEAVIVISQSGETADSLCAMRMARERGVPTVAVVNVVGSSIAREADHVLYTRAGPEIAVATTKAYSAQLALLDLLAVALGRAKGTFCDARYEVLMNSLFALPAQIEEILGQRESIRRTAERFSDAGHLFLVGRGVDFAVCMEGSLKIKEISYIHAEAYAAGELKHGTLSLVEQGTPILGVMTDPKTRDKTLANLREARSRGAVVIALSCETMAQSEHIDAVLPLPETDPLFAASLSVVPLQLLGYHLAVLRGHDVDKPRNLAKSVTVE